MRTLATIGIAATLALGSAAAASPLQPADAGVLAPRVVVTAPSASDGATTQGFITDFNCFFFKRCG
jgi:hypothetical protein